MNAQFRLVLVNVPGLKSHFLSLHQIARYRRHRSCDNLEQRLANDRIPFGIPLTVDSALHFKSNND
jgi:hypothetical protein